MANVNDSNINPKLVKIPAGFSNLPQVGKIQQLYDLNNNDLYKRLSPFTPNSGLLSFGPRQPFVYVSPNKGRKGINGLKRFESRIFPIGSALQDVQRIAQFMVTGKGILFLTKQFLLQRTQPFNETRIYNPLSVINAVVRPVTGFILPPPIRHLSGGLLGALASLVGINLSSDKPIKGTAATGNPNILPKFEQTVHSSRYGKGFTGLIRGGTAASAYYVKKPAGALGGLINFAKKLFGGTVNQPAGTKFRADEAYPVFDLKAKKEFGSYSKAGVLNELHQRWYNDKDSSGAKMKDPGNEHRLKFPGHMASEYNTFVDSEDTFNGESIGGKLEAKYGDTVGPTDTLDRRYNLVPNSGPYSRSEIISIYKFYVERDDIGSRLYDKFPRNINSDRGGISIFDSYGKYVKTDFGKTPINVKGTYSNKIAELGENKTPLTSSLPSSDVYNEIPRTDTVGAGGVTVLNQDGTYSGSVVLNEALNVEGTYSNKIAKLGENETPLTSNLLSSDVYNEIPRTDTVGAGGVTVLNQDGTYSGSVVLNAAGNVDGTYSNKIAKLGENKTPLTSNLPSSKLYNEIPRDTRSPGGTSIENKDGSFSSVVINDARNVKGTYSYEMELNRNNSQKSNDTPLTIKREKLQQHTLNPSSPMEWGRPINEDRIEKLQSMLKKPGKGNIYGIYNVGNYVSDVNLNYTELMARRKSPLNQKSLPEDGYQARRKDTPSLEDNRGKGFAGTGKSDYVNSLQILNRSDIDGHAFGPLNEGGGMVQYKPYESDQIAFYFHDLVNDKYIPFRATVKGLNEQLSADWSAVNYIGRADTLYNYTGFKRTISFDFQIVAMSISELMPMWKRINYLASLTKPSKYTPYEIESQISNFITPPLITFTIGDMYKEQPLILQTVGIKIPEDALWETVSEKYSDGNDWSYLNGKIIWDKSKDQGLVAQFPRECDITISGVLLEQERPQTGKNNFGGIGDENAGNFSRNLGNLSIV